MATFIVNCGFISLQNKRPSCQRFDPFSSTATTSAVSSLSLPKQAAAHGCFSTANRRYLSSGNRTSQSGNRSTGHLIVYAGDQVGDLLPLGIHLPDSWPAWIPGFLLAIVVPFFTNKWGPFGKFKEELDKVEVAVDNVADRVEEMAEKVEHFVDDIANDLPEGSALRQTLENVEKVADAIGKDAHMVSDIVDKMDEMEAKVESMFNKGNEGNDTPSPTTSDVNAEVKPQSTNL